MGFARPRRMRLDRENDIEQLRRAALLLERENKRLVEKITELHRELLTLKGQGGEQLRLRLAELEQQLAARNQRLFGDSSEKRSSEAASGEREKKPQTGHGPREQPALPILECVHDLDEADKVCTSCGGWLAEWAGQFEESEEVDVIGRRFVLLRHKRKKYRCRCGACIETAPAPPRLIEGGRYSTDFAIEVAVSKYLDHAPLERQVRIMAREGLEVDSQTLWDQIDRLATLVRPAYDRLHAHVKSHSVVFADETRWRLMGPKGQDAGEATRWQVWAVVAPDAAYYRIQDSRSTEAAAAVLEGYEGVVMCDGYKAYASLAKQHRAILLAHCWAHVRRKFVEIESFFPQQAGVILSLIGELYAVEQSCPAGPSGDAMRAALRNERSRAILQRIQAWVRTTAALPESGLGKAISYMTGMWTGLTRFLDNPRIPLDNNAAERAERGPVIGRKNHYGSRSRRGTEVAAIFYSLVESAKLAGVEPKTYLHLAVLAALTGQSIPLPHESRG